jgi:peptidoglycan/xylan/chitin deacetylase (PgdA/CDA1 family)
VIALTFDDGPDPRWTPLVLDALAEAGARATFFPLSPRMAAHPELVARMRADGHLVGLHGWGHLRHPDVRRADIEADTDRALAVFDQPPAWFRLPWGLAAPWSAEVAADRGMRVAGWTHDTHDWRGDTAADMLATVTGGGVAPGSVVLAHDALGPGATRAGCAETVALIAPLVAFARANGLEPVRLDALEGVPSGRPG